MKIYKRNDNELENCNSRITRDWSVDNLPDFRVAFQIKNYLLQTSLDRI